MDVAKFIPEQASRRDFEWGDHQSMPADQFERLMMVGCLQRIATALEQINVRLRDQFNHERSQHWKKCEGERAVVASAVEELFAPFENGVDGEAFRPFDRVRTCMERHHTGRLGNEKLPVILRDIAGTDLPTVNVQQYDGIGGVLRRRWDEEVAPLLKPAQK